MLDADANVAERDPPASLSTSLASILVYVDFDAECENRIKIAADWANKFNAALIGVAGWLPGRETGGWFGAELERVEDRNDRILAELERLGDQFRNLANHTVRTVEWRASFHFPREDNSLPSPGSWPACSLLAGLVQGVRLSPMPTVSA